MNHPDRIVQQFTRLAEAFATAPQFTDRQSLDQLLAVTRATADDESLDVACGAGVVAAHFAAQVRHATGIDYTPAMLDKARERQATAGLTNCRWDQGDASRLPYADASFSIVTSRYALHHMAEPGRVLAEMARVCRPGGRLAVADISLPDDAADAEMFNHLERHNDPSHARALTQGEWLQLFDEAGLPAPDIQRYQLEFPLRRMMKGSGVPDEQVDALERDVRARLTQGQLRFCARVADERCLFIYPIAVMSVTRPSRSH